MSLSKRKGNGLKLNVSKPTKCKTYEDVIYANCVNDDFNIPLSVLELNERSEQLARSTFYVNETPEYAEPPSGTTNDLSVGSVVEVLNDVSQEPLYGVVRWMGIERGTDFILVGVELDEEQSHLPLELSDGVHKGERFFRCAKNRALFVPLQQCHKDSRFQDGAPVKVQDVPEGNVSIYYYQLFFCDVLYYHNH